MSEVRLAIYDLSMGMARSLSAQFLGPAHAVEIIPHTAILAFGKEYYFGQGIEWCDPAVFRATRGIQPVEVQSLGRTARTAGQFEEWCRARAADGEFGPASYDFFHRNCNNFSEAAARRGLGLGRGVPPWILELPRKFLSSPLGMAVRPMLEQMQIANTAPTNLPGGGSASSGASSTFAPAPPAPTPTAANPWANIPAASAPAAQEPPSAEQTPHATEETTAGKPPETPLLDKQTALLSTDTNVVKICVDRLDPEPPRRDLLSRLADADASWTEGETGAVHRYLRAAVEGGPPQSSFALMLLRLAVLRRPSAKEQSLSARCVARTILEGGTTTPTARSMAWCVLGNAVGSSRPPGWDGDGAGGISLDEVVDAALGDCDPAGEGARSKSGVALRQSAAAFLHNASRLLARGDGATDDARRAAKHAGDGEAELSEGAMSVLLGCLEHLREETDATAAERLCAAAGQLLKSPAFGRTAIRLVRDLGLLDDGIDPRGERAKGLAAEVASLVG